MQLCKCLTHLLYIAACGFASSTDSQLNDDVDNEVAVIALTCSYAGSCDHCINCNHSFNNFTDENS